MLQLKTYNKRIQINIVGYEFSSSEFPEDLEWLIIKVHAKDELYSWKSQGPFLRVSELLDLKKWFSDINKNYETSRKEISFIENELSFEYYNNELNIIFDYSIHPLGNQYDWKNGNPYIIHFQLNNTDIENIINNISECIKKYKRPRSR